MATNVLSNEKLQLIAAELFIRGRKLKISGVFITKNYFAILFSK